MVILWIPKSGLGRFVSRLLYLGRLSIFWYECHWRVSANCLGFLSVPSWYPGLWDLRVMPFALSLERAELFFLDRRSRRLVSDLLFHIGKTPWARVENTDRDPCLSVSQGWTPKRNEVCRGGCLPRPRYYFFIDLSIWAVDYFQVSISWGFQGRKICLCACGERFNKLRISVGFKSIYFLNFPFTYFYPVVL